MLSVPSQGLTSVLDKMADLSADMPLVKSYVAKLAAQGVSNALVTLQELSDPMQGGAHYPLFLLVLQQLHKIHDADWVTVTFQESKINLQDMLPGMNIIETRYACQGTGHRGLRKLYSRFFGKKLHYCLVLSDDGK